MRLRRRASPPFSLLAKKRKRAAGRSKREEPGSCETARRKPGGSVPGALYLWGTGKVMPAFGGLGAAFGVVVAWIVSLSALLASLSAAGEAGGKPIRGLWSDSGGKTPVKSILRPGYAIPGRGLMTENHRKTVPAPNAVSYSDCSISLVGTPRFKQKRR